MNYQPQSNILSKICFLLTSLLLLSCLINLKIFIYSGLFNYFSFVLGSGSILIAILVWKYPTIKKTNQISITLPFVLFLAWGLFVFIQPGMATQYKHYRIAIIFLFLISFVTLQRDRVISFYKAVAFIATIEGIWCIAQCLGKIPSENTNFDITGSFVNPNVVAMYLALSLPALLYLCFKTSALYLKVIHYLMFLIACIGLLLLECRTALLGGTFSCGLFLIFHFNILRRYKIKYVLFGILAIGILSVPIGKQLYHHKKDSADGRKLIWTISSQMILDSPIRGHGTGMFEREYNLKQSKAIQEEKLSQKELKNASFVLMAYNDYLEQGVEGGIPAVLLFIAMLMSFLYPSKKSKTITLESSANEKPNIHYVAYAGFASFALMAIFNFIIGAIPVMLLFCCYAGILCTNGNQIKIAELSIKPNRFKTILFTLTCITIFIIYGQLKQANAHRQNKKAHEFLITGNFDIAENLLLPLRETQQNSVSFCIIYGNLLYVQHRYEEALLQFNHAKKFSANPKLYDMAARCLFKLKDNNGGISNLYQLTTLSPKTMKYKFDLMQLLTTDKQIKLACTIAQQIVSMQAINPNELTEKYQNKAKLLLKRYPNNATNSIKL